MNVNANPAPDVDAALVLGMASTAIPFARSPEAQAERWLRILRLHGRAGAALQALGVSEAPLEGAGEDDHVAADQPVGEDVVAKVGQTAALVAGRRGSPSVGTRDVLIAVMEVYGAEFDHVLRAHGTDRDEVLARLDLQAA
ncbi:MAG: hypothetical protein ACLQBB_12000 [Solirubrobacteraceae bacterium]